MMITVKCPKCQVDNLYDTEFCCYCGLRLAKDCPNCGSSNPNQFTYCTQCGQSLVSPPVIPIPVIPALETKEESVIIPEATKEEVPEEIKEEPKAEAGEEVKEEVSVAPEAAAVPEPEAKMVPEEIIEEVPKAEVEEEAREEVTIDVMMPDRILTGISGLDSLIGGGFLAGKVYLVSGESGTGKTVFGMQFLYQGLVLGENGIYVSAEDKPAHLVVDAESLGWDLRKYVLERKLGLMDISSYFAEMRAGRATTIDVDAVISDLSRQVREFNARRIVIDTIAPPVCGQEHYSYIQEYVRHLVAAIEDNLGCTVVVTSGIPAGSAAFSRYGIEEFVAEGVIVLGMASFNGYWFRTLAIRKMRSTFSDLNNHFFEIIPQRGMVIRG